jgi:DNA-directed RNA polymerase I subunit RPA2
MVVSSNVTPDLEPLRELFRHHIESFNYMAEKGLKILFESIKPVQIYDSFINKNLRNILCY